MKTILIVENDRVIRSLMGIVLTKIGYSVVSANHAEEAMKLAGMQKYLDLVITNVRLTGKDGFELGAHLRVKRHDLPFLFVSEFIADASPILAESKVPQSDFFLHKPFLPIELQDMIRIILPSNKRIFHSLSLR